MQGRLIAMLLVASTTWLALSACAAEPESSPGDGGGRASDAPSRDEGEWRLVTQLENVSRLSFCDGSHGWMIRERGWDGHFSSYWPDSRELLYTQDGGETWGPCDGEVQAIPSDHPRPPVDVAGLANPVRVDALDREHVVLAYQGVSEGVEGVTETPAGIAVTSDGGRTWRQTLLLPDGELVADTCWSDARHGWMLSWADHHRDEYETRTLWSTDDAGHSWRQLETWKQIHYDWDEEPVEQRPFPWGVMSFGVDGAGWALFAGFGGGMYRSADGGRSWAATAELHETGGWGNWEDAFQAIDGQTLWGVTAAVEMNESTGSAEMWEGWVHHTGDGGRSWQSTSMGGPVEGLYFLDAQRGWIALTTGLSNRTNVLWTKDGGESWTRQLSAKGGFHSFIPAGDKLLLLVVTDHDTGGKGSACDVYDCQLPE